jgi:hypothetical protein
MELKRISRSLLSRIHPFIERNCVLHSVISIRNDHHSPADLVVLDMSSPQSACPEASDSVTATALLENTNGEVVRDRDYSVLKVLLLSQINFIQQPEIKGLKAAPPTGNYFELPTCPVCLHRIDPLRIGLPKPLNHHLCSKFCPKPPNLPLLPSDSTTPKTLFPPPPPCPRQRLLVPWPAPSRCVCCRTIQEYWKTHDNNKALATSQPSHREIREGGGGAAAVNDDRGSFLDDDNDDDNGELSQVFCFDCALQETLWACMTCGYVGCGRYTNKHAARHFAETGHPYSLELATLRIWDYVGEEFAHRPDLLECPCCVVVSNQQDSLALTNDLDNLPSSSPERPGSGWETVPPGVGATSAAPSLANPFASMNGHDHGRRMSGVQHNEKQPKKATMIGEEYEALLQSALEEQAQHYEGKISHLLATLTAEAVDASRITAREQSVIDELHRDICRIQAEIDAVSRELLDAQAQEAGHRATSNSLLREQQVAEDLLKKVHEETLREQQEGRRQMEELELQIADLTANQRMRDQFSQDEELSNAQIFGTSSSAQKQTQKKGGKGFLRRSRK